MTIPPSFFTIHKRGCVPCASLCLILKIRRGNLNDCVYLTGEWVVPSPHLRLITRSEDVWLCCAVRGVSRWRRTGRSPRLQGRASPRRQLSARVAVTTPSGALTFLWQVTFFFSPLNINRAVPLESALYFFPADATCAVLIWEYPELLIWRRIQAGIEDGDRGVVLVSTVMESEVNPTTPILAYWDCAHAHSLNACVRACVCARVPVCVCLCACVCVHPWEVLERLTSGGVCLPWLEHCVVTARTLLATAVMTSWSRCRGARSHHSTTMSASSRTRGVSQRCPAPFKGRVRGPGAHCVLCPQRRDRGEIGEERGGEVSAADTVTVDGQALKTKTVATDNWDRSYAPSVLLLTGFGSLWRKTSSRVIA